MSYHQNDALNRRLFAAIMDAQIAHEVGGRDRREMLRRARVGKHGELARTLDRVLALNEQEMHRFFERVCREYGV